MPTPRGFAEATLILAHHRVGLKPIAAALGVHGSTVSCYLSGRRRAPEALFGVVAALCGPEVAAEVRQAVSEARDAR